MQKLFNISFVICLLIFVIFILYSESVFKFYNPWNQSTANQSISLPNLSPKDLVAAKLYASTDRDRAYDVGVFGNSRMVMLSKAHLGLPKQATFFNFSIGGTSFRQSVRSVEYLAKHDRAPRTVIIGLDNMELQYGGPAYWPEPFFEFHREIADFWTVLRVSKGDWNSRMTDAFKGVDYFFDYSWPKFKRNFSLEPLLTRIAYLSRSVGGVERELPKLKNKFSADGSRPQTLRMTPPDLSNFQTQPPLPGAWSRHNMLGLMRLNELALRLGIRVIVFETPLAPKLAPDFSKAPSWAAEKSRGPLKIGCAGEKVECYPAPVFEQGRDYWPDCCHAPAARLGAYLATLLRKN